MKEGARNERKLFCPSVHFMPWYEGWLEVKLNIDDISIKYCLVRIALAGGEINKGFREVTSKTYRY